MKAKKEIFGIRKDEGPNKLLSLEDAVAQYVLPEMTLHIGDQANAVVRSIIKRFWGKKPAFTVIASSAEDYVLDMIHGGQIRRLIFALCSDSYPTRKPSKIMQRAFREGVLEIENWSLHTIVQRLIAGAMGLPFAPTQSLLNTQMSEENRDAFLEMEDPFGSGQRVGLVRSLQPDLSLVHALAASRAGDAIPALASSSGQGVWGSLASRGGVLVTTEKIVSTSFIRKYSHLVQIPGCLVKSVSLAPKGSHPQGLFNLRIHGIDSYGADYEFMEEHGRASQTREDLRAWIEEWILGCPSHSSYLKKLGQKRFKTFHPPRRFVPSRKELKPQLDQPCNDAERMIVAAARKIIDRLKEGPYSLILTGTGVSMLASWLAYYQIRHDHPDVQLVTGAGLFGYTPYPGEPQRAGSVANMQTAKMLSDVSHMYGVFVGGPNNRCLSVLGTAQIDRWGNMNTSRLPNGLFLTGGGGASDAVNSREVLVVSKQSKDRFVDRVEYMTCPGSRVRILVSDQGIFEKNGSGELVLTAYFAATKDVSSSEGIERIIERIKDTCGWRLSVSAGIRAISAPRPDELAMLRSLDPKGFFIGG